MSRFAMAGLLALVTLAVTGCSKSPDKKMIGEYVDADGKGGLSITADKMTFSRGPMSLSMSYKVVKTDGDKVTIDVSIMEGKTFQQTVTVADDHILLGEGKGGASGRFNRK